MSRTPTPRNADLLETIALQQAGCQLAGSPLYGDVLEAVAADVAAGGPCARVLRPVESAPFGDAVLLRLLAGVHAIVLRRGAPRLAAHYPSVGGRPGSGLGAAFVDAVEHHEAEVVAAMGRCVQTNEAGRSVALLGGYLELARLGLPLRVLEVGASAGLNLRFDQYRYRSTAGSSGPDGSPLVFEEPWIGRAPDLTLRPLVASREGCDPDPIDPTTAEGKLRLRSYLWPDQPERRERLDAALQIAEAVPVSVARCDAVTWMEEVLAEPMPGVCTVLSHSIVFQYLAPADRTRFLELVDEAGERATSEAPFAWLRMEPGGDQAETRLSLWPHGVRELLVRSPYHGPRATWIPTRPVVPAP